ncbi:MAG: hypothetical protein ABI488_13325 [Polyangiaceae bacterium]
MSRRWSNSPGRPRRTALCGLLAASVFVLCGVARAQTTTKTFINYFQPTPITCSLTTNAWGCTATGSTPPNCVSGIGVVPRDTCNGIESSTNPPGAYYWDGTVILAPDGTFHLFADRWAGSQGFNPGWEGSEPIHAVGGKSALGPYTDKGYAYSNSSFGNDPHHGHNSQVVALLNGTYALIVSEVVPFTIFTASSLDGPWTPCSGSPGSGLSVPSGFGGNTTYGSNVSLVVRPDGNFEITQRHGLIALSSNGICGPYKAQQPTNSYPSNEAIPSQFSASIFPNRQKHSDPMGPSTVESTYTLAEDPVIWFSGGQYHVLYDYPDDRVGYHLTSLDGIHNWTDRGLAYDPRYAQQIFSYTDGTVDHWYKMERPNVVIQNGLITYVTFAVSDVDKNNQISAGTNHGSKVIVLPFDGATFDKDTGVGTGGAGGADHGSAGSAGSGGGTGGSTAAAGHGGAGGAGGSAGIGGSVVDGQGGSGTGGALGTGGVPGGSGSGGVTTATGGSGGARDSGSGATSTSGTGGEPGTGGATADAGSRSSGCSCAMVGVSSEGRSALWLMASIALTSVVARRRRRRGRRQ